MLNDRELQRKLEADLHQESDGWKKFQEKQAKLAEEHSKQFNYPKPSIYDDSDDSLHMCGGKGLP